MVLSGGANSRWYFDWFADNYDSSPERHIGVEALAPKPDDLPDNAEWVASTLGDLSAVESGTVDLVFAGEVIEHLWADDIAGFLLESHRVLAPGGRIALDSPNRRVTQAIAWLHPEHTLEFSVDEIAELLELAGFDDVELRGVLRCYDRRRHRSSRSSRSKAPGFHARSASRLRPTTPRTRSSGGRTDAAATARRTPRPCAAASVICSRATGRGGSSSSTSPRA